VATYETARQIRAEIDRWILFDALAPRLQTALGQSSDDARRRHANLE
jgi:hypothetical protein